MNLKTFGLIFFLIVFFSVNTFAYCSEERSYHKTWTLQARDKEETREKRQKYYESLTKDERARISDFEIYPTNLMTCGMGFSEGLAKVFVGGKAGFINNKGKIVINPRFKDVGRFSENLSPAEFDNGKWGYINKKGTTIIKPRFDWALIFREGLALVQIDDKWGFIDSTGKIIVEPQFSHANSFSEGLAMVQMWGIDELYEKDFKVLKTGYIDKFGKWIIQPTWDGGDDFEDGKTTVDKHLTDKESNKNYYGCFMINITGKIISEELENCSRSLKSQVDDSNEIVIYFEEYKTGYKNKTGKIIWKPTK